MFPLCVEHACDDKMSLCYDAKSFENDAKKVPFLQYTINKGMACLLRYEDFYI